MWRCYFFHKWTPWSDPKKVSGKRTNFVTWQDEPATAYIQTRVCERCKKFEYEEV